MFQSVHSRKITNQVVILRTYEVPQQNSGKPKYQSFLCLVSLDYVGSEIPLDRIVQVHQITIESIPESGYGIENTPNLPFGPTQLHLNINPNESNFVVYGERGIIVGNFPVLLQNLQHRRSD